MTPILQFDFRGPDGHRSPILFADPVEVVSAIRVCEVAPALERVQQALDRGLFTAGFVAYEAAPAFDSAMRVPPASDLPLVWFGLFEGPPSVPPQADGGQIPSPLAGRVREGSLAGRAREGWYRVGDWTCEVDEARFSAELESIRESIAAGDVYQVNHTIRMRASFEGDARAWYRHLSRAQRAGYTAFLDLGAFQIVSLSPELFFRIDTDAAGRAITTRPMKGTHRRGRWASEDAEFAGRLAASDKDRAENVMIVDLLRNDLGRIAKTGTVRVEQLFQVERYPTLLQMTSTVSARVREECGLPEILRALFPCGSVTGAPKIAAMGKVADLEPDPRQVYCGAIGYMAPDGGGTFSVAIRTALIDTEAGIAEYSVGSGITWDSRPDGEYAENRLKAEVLHAPGEAPTLFETLRLADGIYTRPARHVDRLAASADYFGIPLDRAVLRAALDRQASERPDGIWRVRLILTDAGEVSTVGEPLQERPEWVCKFALDRRPIDRWNRLLFHKIADRAEYTSRKSERPDVYDVLMQNREGELTEFTTGNLVLVLDGDRLTPPLDCGLLPGVLRAELLDSGAIRERSLTPADLKKATSIWLINSLRGWVPMEWQE